MKRYELLGGGIIEAETPADFVAKLNEHSIFGSKESLKKFMASTAQACHLQTSAIIRTKNFVVFLEDLKKHRFVKEV